MAIDELSRELAEFDALYLNIERVSTPPKTTLEILEKHYDEDHWNRLLKYFLDPKAPHGFDEAALLQFLELVEGRCDGFYFDRHAIDKIDINREVLTPNNNRADIVITYEQEWFIWIEMKVRSREGPNQTNRYVEDDYIGDTAKSAFDEGNRFYVYLAPERSKADADEFVNLDWATLSTTFQSLTQTAVREQPLQSYAQFTDFLNTVRNEINMTQHEETRQEKVELAIEYYDSINDVREAFNSVVENHQENWPQRFEPHAPAGWNDNWHCHTGSSNLTFYKQTWPVADVESGEDVSNSHPLRPYFQHVISSEQIANNRLKFKTQLTGANDELNAKFQDYLYSAEVQTRLEEIAANIDQRKGTEIRLPERDDRTYTRFTITTYPFDWEGGEGYYRTLAQALTDHQEVEEIFDEAIQEITNEGE